MTSIFAGQTAAAAWRATGPFGGEAQLVRVVPKVKDKLIAGTRNSLLFVSTNGGASWNNIAFPAQFAGVLHALEVDPGAADIWYAGVESDNQWLSGIYKTTDAGRSWVLLPQTKGLSVWSLALWPGDSRVIAAGTNEGVSLSRDGGETWKRITSAADTDIHPVVSLALHPADSRTIYAGTTHLPWRTTDGGAKWESIHEGMIDDSDVFSIQVDPLKPERVFSSACSGVYGSVNGGARWSRLETPKGAFRTHFVAIAPPGSAGRDDVFAGTTEGLLKSADGGRTWRKVTGESVQSVTFDPWVPGRAFFASTTAGLLVSTDGGNTVREINTGFANRSFTTLTGSGAQLYSTSVYDSAAVGVYHSGNLGLRWVQTAGPAGDQLLVMAAAPDNPNVLFAAGYHGLFASGDSGKSWEPRKGPAERITALLPFSGKDLLAGTDQGLFRSGDGGHTWARCQEAVCTGGIESLRVSGKARVSALTARGAAESADGGITWRQCGEPSGNNKRWYGIDFDPVSGNTALAATPAGLFRSTDSCATWTPVRSGLREETATIVLFHPTHSGEAYVSQGGNVFRSTDGGQHWLPLDDEGTGNSGPSSLFVLPAAPDRLFALFPRRGVFSTSIKEKPLQ